MRKRRLPLPYPPTFSRVYRKVGDRERTRGREKVSFPVGGADDKYRFHLDPIVIERKQTPVLEQARDLGRRIAPSPFLISSHSPTSAASGLVFCGRSFFAPPFFELAGNYYFRRLAWRVCFVVFDGSWMKMKILQFGKIFYPLKEKLITKKKRLSRERERGSFSNFFQDFWLPWITLWIYKREYYNSKGGNLTGRYTGSNTGREEWKFDEKLENFWITFVTSRSNYHFVKNLFVISQNQRDGIEISYDDDFAIFLHWIRPMSKGAVHGKMKTVALVGQPREKVFLSL